MSRVYRFHSPAEISAPDRCKLFRKRKARIQKKLHLIGVDNSTISDQHGVRAIEEYPAIDARAITLTRREADLIALANPGFQAPDVLEEIHPWLPECRFLNNSSASLRELEAIMRRFQRHFVSASSYCDEKWNTICNALRLSSAHDFRFYSAWHLPIQEAYNLEELRPDRTVIAIDFNGMYPSCMQYEFPKPSGLQLVQFNRVLDPNETLTAGLYRCILSEPTTEFIIRHNPLRSFHSGRHLRTRLNEPITIDLNEFELTFFSRHFRRIHLIEAVVSRETVPHPLAREVKRSFARRKNYREQGNKALADREKFLATLMTSCASRPSRSRQTFSTRTAAMQHVRSQYGIEIPPDEPEVASDIWLDGRKGVTVRDNGGCVELIGPALPSSYACHLLGQRIVARSRIVLLKMMERILGSAPDVQICYANIDSIHFSLPSVHKANVIAWLEREASELMGSFKIEAISRHGLWLEPGRYWLHSDDEIVKFRNRSIGDRQKPFADHSMHVATRRVGELYVPIKVTLDMERTMSPSRSIDIDTSDSLSRQSLIEVGDSTSFANVLDELERNKKWAIPARLQAFRHLHERIETSRAAASGREAVPLSGEGRRPPP